MHVMMLALPAHGHINPMLPLAERLVAAGERVTFATTAEFAGAVGAAGAAVLPIGESFAAPAHLFTIAPDGGFANPELAAFFDRFRDAAPRLLSRIASEQPDAFVYDTLLALLSPAYHDVAVPRVAFFPQLRRSRWRGAVRADCRTGR